MKKVFSLLLSLTMVMALLAGCGGDTTADDTTDDTASNDAAQEETAELSGTVATDGSTSMEEVIGALGEQFMADNSGVSVTYNPTGSVTSECPNSSCTSFGAAPFESRLLAVLPYCLILKEM